MKLFTESLVTCHW